MAFHVKPRLRPRGLFDAALYVYAALLAGLLVAVLLGVAPRAALGAETLTTRACPTQAQIDAGMAPDCATEGLYIEEDGVCGAILRDLAAGRLAALIAAMPETATRYARYSGQQGSAWCVTEDVTFAVPAIPAP